NRWSGTKHVALEACHVWEHVYDAATKAADRVVLSNPFKTRLISEASLKNDKVDADALAELLRLNGLPESYAPNQEIRDLRQLVRDRQFYKDLEKNVKNHIYSILLRKGIEYQDQHLKSKARREALRKLSLPQIDRGLDALEDLRDRVKDLDKAITKEFETNKDAQLLASIPGIGELTSLTLVAELCPIHRFANIEKVASYCGFVPTNWQSGEVEYHGRMKRKDANSLLKKILVEAAWAHRRLAPASSDVAKIGKRVARKHGAGKGSGAAAHKLLKIVYAVLKRGTPYTPERPGRVLDPAESSGGRVKVGAGSRSGPDGRVSS
ncbi:MAG: IS110 family transposase, partial [Euryarchaeota archaeon]|nr:IS110 family transposase [Euryarchaeota archaeon]